jgi:DNA-binding NarL/FixJ family response regulator
MTMTVLLIDDHDIVRAGLRQMIQMDRRLRITCEASTGEEGVRFANENEPELVITDLHLPDIQGEEVVRRILESHPAARIMVVSGFIEVDQVKALQALGVKGILGKTRACHELRDALDAIFTGGTFVSPSLRSL